MYVLLIVPFHIWHVAVDLISSSTKNVMLILCSNNTSPSTCNWWIYVHLCCSYCNLDLLCIHVNVRVHEVSVEDILVYSSFLYIFCSTKQSLSH